MAIITRAYSEVTGQIAYASSINKVINDLYTLQAGNLNSANLGTSVIGTSLLSDLAVVESKIADLAVTDSKVHSIGFNKLAASGIWETQQLILGGF